MLDIVIVTEKGCLTPNPTIPYNAAAIREDGVLVNAFLDNNLTCQRVAWDDDSFDWTSTKIALIKSTWNYPNHIAAFKSWLAKVSNCCTLINDKDLVLWNMDKRYLLELQAAGVAIPETYVLDDTITFDAEQWNEKLGNQGIVVKPTVSAGAKDTYYLTPPFKTSDLEATKASIKKCEMIIQPFLPSIVKLGEISIVFINGEYSHAMLKTPKPADFRVQAYHGGSLSKHEPTVLEIAFGQHVLEVCQKLKSMPLYARIDICYGHQNEILLMELEAIEPELWYPDTPLAVSKLVAGIKNLLWPASK